MSRYLILLLIMIGLKAQVSATQHKAPPSLLELQYSPSAYECAVLSQHIYRDDVQVGDQVELRDEKGQVTHSLPDWRVYKILQEKKEALLTETYSQLGFPYQYKAILYFNQQKRQFVLTHRGIDAQKINTAETNALVAAQHTIASQGRCIPAFLAEVIAIAQKHHCYITTTGHSLGGWLAQITAFVVKDLYPEYHVKAFTFDSPGAGSILKQMNARVNPVALDQLDITNYLSSPNLINASGAHVGTIYQIVFKHFSKKPAQHTLESHALENFLYAFDPQTGKARQCVFVESWPIVSKRSLGLSTKISSQGAVAELIYLFDVFKKCTRHETLSEYDDFFKFSRKINWGRKIENILCKKGRTTSNNVYRYQVRAFDPSIRHIRHFPKPAQRLLKAIQTTSEPHVPLIAQEQWLQSVQYNPRTGLVRSITGEHARIVGDRLMSLALDHPDLLEDMRRKQLMAKSCLSLPLAVPFFVGRKRELDTLCRTFHNNQKALIIAPPITGPGGIGKTQLALKLVQELEEEQYDYILWIPAESESKLTDAYVRIAKGLGIYVEKPDEIGTFLDKDYLKQVVQRVRAHLKDYNCLYIFDDAPDIETVQKFSPLEQGHVLITSRNSSARAWPLHPLILQPFDEQEAIALAGGFGYGNPQKELKELKILLSRVPTCPLTLTQLFSKLEAEGFEVAELLGDMAKYTATEQEQKLIEVLSERPHAKVKYTQSVVYVFKTTLEQLKKEDCGLDALALLSRLAYLDPKGIPTDWLLSWDLTDNSLLKHKARKALSLLEKHSLVQWNRKAEQVYIHADTQLIVRYLYPQATVAGLVNNLVQYLGDEEKLHRNPTKWVYLLPHGRILYTRLNTTQYPQEGYSLTRYLTKACQLSCLYEEAVAWAKNGLAIVQQHYATQNHMHVANALNYVGCSLWELGNHQEAQLYHEKALAIRKNLYQDQDHLEIAESLNNLGTSLWGLGLIQKALAYHKQALAMRKRIYKDQDHDKVAESLNDVGCHLIELGSCEEALSYFQRTVDMLKRIYPNQAHPYIAIALGNLGYGLEKLNKHQEAMHSLEEAITTFKEIYKNQVHPQFALVLSRMAYNAGILYKDQEALTYINRAINMVRALYQQQDHPFTARILNNTAKTFLCLQSYQKGLAYCQEALHMQQRLYNNRDHPHIADTLYNLGNALKGLQKATEAANSYRQAACTALRFYKKEHPCITQYVDSLILALQELKDESLICQTQEELLPLCNQFLGAKHVITQQLRAFERHELVLK